MRLVRCPGFVAVQLPYNGTNLCRSPFRCHLLLRVIIGEPRLTCKLFAVAIFRDWRWGHGRYCIQLIVKDRKNHRSVQQRLTLRFSAACREQH